MRTTIAIVTAGATLAGAAFAQGNTQDNSFRGIEGELPKVTTEDSSAGTRTQGLSFSLDPDRNRELDKATGVIPVGQSQFYRPSILNARRAKRTDGTGLTIFDKILDLD